MFKKDDIVVQIENSQRWRILEMFWVVRSVEADGYYLDSIYKGRFIPNEAWMPFSIAHNHLLKVDEWDRANMCVKGGEVE